MKKILITAVADATSNPRPNRMIHFLKEEYEIYFLGLGCITARNVHFIPLPLKNKTLFQKVKKLALLKLRKYDNALRLNNEERLLATLKSYQFDAIVCHDLTLLPLLSKVDSGKKILFDAREYYPRHFEDRPLWKFFNQGLNEYLCKRYLSLPNCCMTVSKGLADEYFREFGVKMEVIFSLPQEEKYKPSAVDPNNIKMIYHGNAIPSRQLETMIQVMTHVDERFSLDLMLVTTHPSYYSKLKKLVKKHTNINIIPPVSFNEIIQKTNRYDIGFYFCLPSSFNVKHMMPNKLFEFVQARLAVAIGPSPDMKKFVEQQGVGIVAEDFSPRSMASALNSLSTADIIRFKQKSNEAAKQFNASVNKKKILELIDQVI